MHLLLAITFVTLVHSTDATLVTWIEDAHVKARVGDTTIDLGNGNDVRAATDGHDFQIVWVDQGRVLGTRWSKPSEIQTFGNGDRTPPVVWNGSAFQLFAGSDAAAALQGVALTTTGASTAAYTFCSPFPTFGGPKCTDVAATFRIDWTVRSNDAPSRSFTTASDEVSSPAAVAGNDEFLIVWKSSIAIEGVRVHRDGSTASFINVPMMGKGRPQVAWDGTRYLIVFEAGSDVWGAFVTPGLTYVAQPFAIAATSAEETAPAVAAIGPDRFAVAYVVDKGQIATRVVSFNEPPSKRRAAR